MAANTTPIFPLTPTAKWGVITTANTAKDGTGTVVAVATGGTNGSRIDKIRVRALGTNIQTVLRVFINNGLTNVTAANNSLIFERTIPATTLSETTELLDIQIPLDIALPATYILNCTIGTTIAAGIQITSEGGDY